MNKDTGPVFECRQCGQCCAGVGGIVLGLRDVTRLSRHFGVAEETFLSLYAERHNGKNTVRTGPDGNCLFFRTNFGCSVHKDKPEICRAWPFFRGNLVDPVSLAMAKDFCPGIRRDVTYTEFVLEGRRYLQQYGLNNTSDNEANALLS